MQKIHNAERVEVMAYPCMSCADKPVGYKCPKAKSCEAYQKHTAKMQAAKEAERKAKELSKFLGEVTANGIRNSKGDQEHWRRKRIADKRGRTALRLKQEEEMKLHEHEL